MHQTVPLTGAEGHMRSAGCQEMVPKRSRQRADDLHTQTRFFIARMRA